METFLLNLLKTSLLGSLAILAMLVLKPLWRERYRAKTRCWLWLALAAFLLLPVDFSVKNAPVQAAPPKDYTLFVGTDKTTIQSTDNLFGDMAEKSGQSPAQVRDTIIQRPVTNPEQKTTRYIPVTTILFYGYLAGAAAFLLYQGVSYALFRRTVRRWKRDVARADYAAMLSDTARDLGVSAPEMIVCEAISTPAVTGLLRPRLLLPHERYDVQELRYILRHELCHLKRRDMLLKLVLLAANAMHWFNPVVYLMLRQADEDIELACDSAATDGLELPERAAYSRTLLAAVQSSVRALPATTCFGGTVERLKRRITNVLGAQKKRGLGVVALVLALTLTAGCAVSWGERGKKNSDPFDGTRYNPVLVVANWELTIGKNFRPLYYVSDESGTYFRLSREDGVNTVTMIYDGGETAFAPLESVTLTQENFDGTLLPDLDALRGDNKAAWRVQLPDNFDDHDPEASPNLVFLLEQEDGTLYLCIGYHFNGGDAFPEDSDRIRWVYRLEKQDDTIYASMDDYAAACVEDLKKGTMTYSVSENNDYASRSIEDTVADVRVTQLEQADSLGNLSPDGTVLELWYFQYEMKPTNEAGMQIDVIGGQELTDDGYLNENWTHYLTVLHYTSGEKTGYQVIGTYTGNDGLWYNGCSYSGEEKYYLHDFYVDYAGLDLPKMFIPNLLNAATDGYGRANQCEARLISGDGSYYFYAPITAWACNPGTEFWYSRYDTGSYFNAKKLEQSLDEAKAEWESTGAKAEKTDAGWRFVTHEGMSNTIVTLFDAPDGTCYEVTTHWTFDGSTEENQWGWNRDRAVEGEAEVLRAMVRSFTVNWDADAAADPALDDSDFQADLQLATNGGASWMYLSKNSAAVSDCNMRNVTPTVKLDECSYALLNEEFTPDDGKQTLTLWLSNNDSSHLAFYEGTNVMLYQRDDARYYKVSNFGDYATLYDAMLAWFNSAQSGTETSDASSTTTTNAVSRDSLIKAADSYVDLGGYLWYTADGKFYRWREGSAVETICTLPIDSLTDSPVRATLSIRGSRVALNYHIGGATMGTYVTELYNPDGEQYVKIDGYESIAFDNHGNIVKTLQFPPAQNNLSISYDSGKTWTSIGDADYFYGSVTEDGSSISYFPGALEIRDGYVYTTAVYDIDHQKTSDPLVTHSVRVNLKTGAQEILD